MSEKTIVVKNWLSATFHSILFQSNEHPQKNNKENIIMDYDIILYIYILFEPWTCNQKGKNHNSLSSFFTLFKKFV